MARFDFLYKVERFTGLNFHGFHPMKFFMEKFCDVLHSKHLNNAIIYTIKSLISVHGKLS